MIGPFGPSSAVDAGQHDTTRSGLVSRGRATAIHAGLVLFALALVARAVQVQIMDGSYWEKRADRQHFAERTIPAPRGPILDESGKVLVESREMVQLRIAPREVRRDRRKGDDGPQLAKGLASLGVPRLLIQASLDTSRKWVEIPHMFVPREAQSVMKLRHGVYPQWAMQRVSSAPEGVKRLVGGVDAEGNPIGGIEQELDSMLRGQRGTTAGLRDGKGNVWESPSVSGVAATPGNEVSLTINSTLQDICEKELALALTRTGSTGGDVVVMDPRDGAVLALAGYRNGKASPASTPLTEGYEPGSVLKTFVVARLLDQGTITPDDVVNTEGGTWMLNKRKITDEHKRPSMTVRDVIRFSSNIGIVKLSSHLSSSAEYELLRDFGFGSFTGVPYPAESRGRLPLPKSWTAQTPASLVMGYELLVTPLQLAAAYVSVANGGELLQPALVREIRSPDGTVLYHYQRRVVRRVLSPRAAESIRVILESVVDSGTATAAELRTFDVAGKSGTARRGENGHYIDGKYNATFAGMFPAKHPQYIVVARLIDPHGKIFGGLVAAPVVNRILQSALASHDVALDRTALAQAARPMPPVADRATAINVTSRGTTATPTAASIDSAAAQAALAPLAQPPGTVRVVVSLPYAAKATRAVRSEPHTVPDVGALDLRDAVRSLHAAGYSVRLAPGVAGRTHPSAGTLTRSGGTVILEVPR